MEELNELLTYIDPGADRHGHITSVDGQDAVGGRLDDATLWDGLADVDQVAPENAAVRTGRRLGDDARDPRAPVEGRARSARRRRPPPRCASGSAQ
jgi:hypothetical protein